MSDHQTKMMREKAKNAEMRRILDAIAGDAVARGIGVALMTADGPKHVPLDEFYEKPDPDEAREWRRRFEATASDTTNE